MSCPTGMVQRSLVVVLALATTVLTGCSEQPSRAGSGPPKKPSSSTTSASPTPLTPEEQVAATVRAYYATLTEAVVTGDTTELREMVHESCPCYRPVRVLERNAARGYRVPQASFRVLSVDVHYLRGSLAVAKVKTDESPYQVVDGQGEVVGRIEARRNLLDLTLERQTDGRWLITNEFDLVGRR